MRVTRLGAFAATHRHHAIRLAIIVRSRIVQNVVGAHVLSTGTRRGHAALERHVAQKLSIHRGQLVLSH